MPPGPSASIAQAPVPSASPQTHAASRSSRSKPAPPAPSSSTAQPTELSGEIALIQRAKQALAIQDPDGALAVLSTYASRYPHGTLPAEAGYLRVQALLAQGDRGAAMEVARRLLAADPRGVLAPKLRAIVDSEPIP
jgi:TolA-binding protein